MFGQIFQPVENSSSAMWTQRKRRKEEKSYQAPLRASSFLLLSFFTRRKEYQFNKLVPGYYPHEIQIQFLFVCLFFFKFANNWTGLGLGQLILGDQGEASLDDRKFGMKVYYLIINFHHEHSIVPTSCPWVFEDGPNA